MFLYHKSILCQAVRQKLFSNQSSHLLIKLNNQTDTRGTYIYIYIRTYIFFFNMFQKRLKLSLVSVT